MRKKKRRGVSFGTVLMLAITLCVVGALAFVLPRLQGETELNVDAGDMLSALKLSDLPKLEKNDIPIQAQATAEPTEAAATTAPTLAPKTAEAVTTAAPTYEATLCFGGSVMVQSGVRKSAYYSAAKDYDFTDIFTLMASSMQSDFTMVTLENLIVPSAKVSDTVAPEQIVPMLTGSGANGVALGFPEVFDQGSAGVASTINALQGKGLAVIGAYTSAEEAANVTTLTLGGMKVALLHYTSALTNTGKKKIKNESAADLIPLIDTEKIASDIGRAKQQGAQAVIVSLNWGSDGKTAVTKDQKAIAQTIADSGADLIIGAGSETVQSVEWLNASDGRQVLCAYSLGMLLGDSRKNANVAGLLLKVKIGLDADGNLDIRQVSGVPTYIWRYKQEGQYHYRVLPSNSLAPDGMDSDQISAMTKALKTVQSALDGSPVSLGN